MVRLCTLLEPPSVEMIVTHREFRRQSARRGDGRLLRAAVVAAFLVCGVAAVPAGAQSLSSVLDHSRYSTADRREIGSILQQFEAEGVPQNMLLPRLQEGIARGVPSHVVIGVLSRNARLLLRARGILQTLDGGAHFLADQSAWSLSAAILGAGGDPATIRALAHASEGSIAKYRAALVLYGSLANWGLDSKDIVGVTLAAVQSSLPAAQYASISGIFIRSRALQIPPEEVAKRLLQALPRSRSYEELQREVLY